VVILAGLGEWWRQRGAGRAHELACRLGQVAHEGGRHGTAFRIFAVLAERGHGESLFHLGHLHERGLGAPADAVQAALRYRQAALRGHDEAQYRLACLYASGQGFMRDPLQAQYWLHQAARQGHEAAQRHLAVWVM